ncbi:pyridoxal-phosphate dependent enzyme family protein [hydrothermal vent metagenome]|uniref:Pyridoxal-phosphate dependent enzyme family protein n=1 Tax=hydrothermal vent metagenome TaxID=652676 RepID=A0A3B0XN22_9ZZZZ
MLTIKDVYDARKNVYKHLSPTPLYSYPTLNQLLGTNVWIKHENHQPVGAFKIRGGLNLAANLSAKEKENGLFTASTGNHGQSIAYAARAYGISATIAVPENANPGKVSAMQGMGAKVIHHGDDFDEARAWIKQIANEQNGKFVGPTDEHLVHGVGTYALEILEELPIVDTIIVPVGAGSGVCATGIVAKAINKNIEIIAVQSAQAPAMQLSWKSGTMVEAEMNTFAEGVATRVPIENTQQLMQEYVDDFLLADDKDIRASIKLMMEHTHNLIEEAAAIPLAVALDIKPRLQGKNVVLIASGGNISMENIRAAVAS